MTHFDIQSEFFIKREAENWILNDAPEEYVPFDYDLEDDILPHLINFLGEEHVEVRRALKNVKIFRYSDGIGFLFRNFDFTKATAINSLANINDFEYLRLMIFMNCRLGGTIVDAPPSGLAFYDCVVDERFALDVQGRQGSAGKMEFNKCVINSELDFQNISSSADITITECLFNENSILNMAGFANKIRTQKLISFNKLYVKNSIFKGEVNFHQAHIPERSCFDTLTFYKDINFTEASFGERITFHNLCFAPFTNKTMKDGFKSFTEALATYGYKKEAKFYEESYNMENKKINKDEYDIARESGWLNIKQAALFLGYKYTTLLDMRKDDKVLGQQRIPYVGKGKNSRYYVPLLKAYKDGDMRKVAELEKEMRRKGNKS